MKKRDMKMDEVLAEQCYVNPSEFDRKKYAALIRADEREECAKLCDERVSELYASRDTVDCAEYLAGQIRARSKA